MSLNLIEFVISRARELYVDVEYCVFVPRAFCECHCVFTSLVNYVGKLNFRMNAMDRNFGWCMCIRSCWFWNFTKFNKQTKTWKLLDWYAMHSNKSVWLLSANKVQYNTHSSHSLFFVLPKTHRIFLAREC